MGTDRSRGRTWWLLPGTLCDGRVFDGFLDALGVSREDRKPLEMGYPHVEDYTDKLCRSVRPGDIVCGFSLGAIVAAHHADRLDAERMLLFAPNPYSDDPAKEPVRRDLARDVRTLGASAALAPRLPPMGGPTPKRCRDLILRMADATSDLIDAQTELALSRQDAIPRLRAARMPILVVAGAADRQVPPEVASAAADAAPVGRCIVVPGLGHYALIEDATAAAAPVAGNDVR